MRGSDVPSRRSSRTATGAEEPLGHEEAQRLLAQLVAIAPTNLEDPIHRRWEKPHYLRASEAIVRAARARGLATEVYDPVVAGDVEGDWHGANRPNVIIDLDAGARSTTLILAHYDVVPVPAEQLARWKTPPFVLTRRSDGRLYGRGANDDLGSGVVASLTALGHLAEAGGLRTNVRLLVCCDEETGGEGGVEAILKHDARLTPTDPGRILRGDVALIPDGSPEATAGSSGIAFLQTSFDRPVPLRDTLAFGQDLVDLHELAKSWRSVYDSPDWPDRNAPDPKLTGRASVTQFDLRDAQIAPEKVGLLEAHAETDAANQIGRAVTLLFGGPTLELDQIAQQLRLLVRSPFRLERAGASALEVPPGTVALQLVGEATHGGYPHRGHNPVPEALRLLSIAAERGLLDAGSLGTATFTVDVRLIPEMELPDGLDRMLAKVRSSIRSRSLPAKVEAPPERCRAGYALRTDHPALGRLARILESEFGVRGIFGEYGGTDASALRGLTTPNGEPLPALVFGSMDPAARIHDAEENLDPALFHGVVRTLERFVTDA